MDVWRSRPSSRPTAPLPSGDGAEGEVLRLDQTPPPGPPAASRPAPGLPDPTRPQPGEMPFLDHLEEMRWRIFKALAGVAAASVVCLFFAEWIIDAVLLGPTKASFFMYDVLRMEAVDVVLQNRTVTGQFFAYFGTVLATGLVLGSPVVVFQIWRFVEPGLYPEERHGVRFAALFATAFFVIGISFGFLVLAPIALQFFAQFQVSESILNEFDISKYFSMLLGWSFGAGLLFELPVIVFVLARIGVLNQRLLRTGRKYALVAILIIAAFLTPPDPMSQIVMAIPLLGLYELSIVLTGYVERARAKREAAEAKAEAARRLNDAPPAAE